MAFVQIIEMRTQHEADLHALGDEYFAATEGKRTLQRSVLTRDRNDPEHYFVLAFFDSYESAMENSELPETAEFAEKEAALLEGPPTFLDLDVIEERS